jgi:hypothetical protein
VDRWTLDLVRPYVWVLGLFQEVQTVCLTELCCFEGIGKPECFLLMHTLHFCRVDRVDTRVDRVAPGWTVLNIGSVNNTSRFGTAVTAQNIAHPDKGHVTVPDRCQGGTRRRRTRACGGACRGPLWRSLSRSLKTESFAKPVAEYKL